MQGKTTVRGGYQIQFLGGGRGFVLDTAIGNPPGSSNTANYIIPASDPYFSIEKLVATPASSRFNQHSCRCDGTSFR